MQKHFEHWEEEKFKRLIGRTVKDLVATDTAVALDLDDGTVASIRLHGECCSHSYFTDLRQFQELKGRVLNAVEVRHNNTEDRGRIEWSFLVFVTDAGHVTVDWRNDSNGYYSGYIETNYRKAAVS